MVLLCFKLFISLACSYQVTGKQSGLRGARTHRVAGFGTCPGLREYGQKILVLEGCLNDTLNDTSTTPGHKRRAAYPSISGGQRTSVKKHVMERVGRRSIYTLPAFLPSCLPAFLPSCLPAFLPSCLPAFLPSCLLPSSLAPFLLLLPCLPPLLPCLPSSSSLSLPPFLFLPSSSSLPFHPPFSLPFHPPFSLAPSFLAPLLPGFLYPFLPILLPFVLSPPAFSSSILSLSPFHPSLT